MIAKNAGRTIGTLLLVQLVGLILPFVLLLPLGRDFMTTAAPAAGQIRTAVILLFANGGLTIWLSFLVARCLRDRGAAGALWLVAAGVIMCVLQAVDNACILSLLAVSERSVNAAAPDEALAASGAAIHLIRQWAHTIAILTIDVWNVSLYVLLRRRHAVPGLVTALGLGTTALHGVGIPLRSLLGFAPVATMGMPMALGHLVLAAWLIVKGLPRVSVATPQQEEAR